MPVTPSRSRLLPILYPLIALVVGALLLPSALRPPPEQTSDSAALNPDAPPDEQQEQIVQAIKQAQGGAGNADDELTTTTTTQPEIPSGYDCFAGRQIESVYSAPCAAKFSGKNGGATYPLVSANEVRLGLWHAAAVADPGPIADDPKSNESGAQRTYRVLQRYFNKHFETYGRRITFYGLTGDNDPANNQAAARDALAKKVFVASHLNLPFCEAFVSGGGGVMCNPQIGKVYDRNRPGFFSFMLDRSTAAAFAGEYVCRRLPATPAIYSGTERNKNRKISVVTESSIDSGQVPLSEYQNALQKECGRSYSDKSYAFGAADAGIALNAATQMNASGVTTVVLEIGVVNTLLLMTAAQSIGWQPEWVMVNTEALDFSSNAAILPATQSQHLFGLTSWEIPRRVEETECYTAYKEIDPDNEPEDAVCRLMWHQLVLMVSAIQQAGPNLTRASFEKGLFSLGHRYPAEPWAIGGGYGPGDYSYMDDVSEVWFSRAEVNPANGQPGAYVFTHGAKRYKRGQLPPDEGQLFHHGVTTPGGADVNA